MTTAAEPSCHADVHIRSAGPEVRSLLIAAKVIAVALYIGGLAAVTFIWVGSDYNAIPHGDPRREWVINLVGRLMVFFVVPALIVAMLLGVLLLLRRPRYFLTARWLRVKLALLLIVIPAGHFWCRAQTLKLREAGASVEAQAGAARGLSYGLIGTLVGSIAVVVIGKTKPRFGRSDLPITHRS